MNELDLIKERYTQRNNKQLINLYLASSPYIYMSKQEKERALFRLFKVLGYDSLSNVDILEIGCGRGDKIIDLLQMGFSPEHIIGNELMQDNLETAKCRLPEAIKLLNGDARTLPIESQSLDIVYQSMVFSSILDDNFQRELAKKIWQWVKPGGGILWYDFIYNNPKNKNVRGVSVPRIKELFPLNQEITIKRVTLAPPLSRGITKVHPSLYTVLNIFPFLRSHVLCFIKKKE